MQKYSVSEARRKIADIVAAAQKGESTVITLRNKFVAAVVSAEDHALITGLKNNSGKSQLQFSKHATDANGSPIHEEE